MAGSQKITTRTGQPTSSAHEAAVPERWRASLKLSSAERGLERPSDCISSPHRRMALLYKAGSPWIQLLGQLFSGGQGGPRTDGGGLHVRSENAKPRSPAGWRSHPPAEHRGRVSTSETFLNSFCFWSPFMLFLNFSNITSHSSVCPH